MSLLAQVLNPRNMATTQKRVIANNWEAGVDRMRVSELRAYMVENRPFIQQIVKFHTVS